MTSIDTAYLKRCIKTLEAGLERLRAAPREEAALYDLYRAGVVKEYEIILEQSGSLLRKCMLPYFHSKRAADKLPFKDVFRHAGRHGLLTIDEVERWLHYRDNRNITSHDYGADFAEQTPALLPQFIRDAGALAEAIDNAAAAAT